MAVTNIDGLLEAWATQTEAMQANYETIYGPSGVTPTLPAVTTDDGLLEAIAEEVEKAVKNVAIDNSAYYDNIAEAYSISIPAGLIKWYGLKRLGGKTIVMNEKVTRSFSNNTTGLTFTKNADESYTVNGTSAAGRIIFTATTLINTHKYYIYGCPSGYSATIGFAGLQTDKGNGAVWTSPYGQSTMRFNTTADVVYDNVTLCVNAIDLTLAFGAGNEPTLEQCKVIFPKATYETDITGTLVSAGITQVVSKDSNSNIIDTLVIPDEVQALTGYGWSCPNHTNYIDFEAKKYYQYVGERAYIADDDNDSTVVTDGTTTHYPLDTPVETDISEYLTDTDINAAAGGTVTFECQHNGEYNIPVPIEAEYIAI